LPDKSQAPPQSGSVEIKRVLTDHVVPTWVTFRTSGPSVTNSVPEESRAMFLGTTNRAALFVPSTKPPLVEQPATVEKLYDCAELMKAMADQSATVRLVRRRLACFIWVQLGERLWILAE
jgi:hypothetical protein